MKNMWRCVVGGASLAKRSRYVSGSVLGVSIVLVGACGPSAEEMQRQVEAGNQAARADAARAKAEADARAAEDKAHAKRRHDAARDACLAGNCSDLAEICRAVPNTRHLPPEKEEKRRECAALVKEVVASSAAAGVGVLATLASNDFERFTELSRITGAIAEDVLCNRMTSASWAEDDDLLNGEAEDMWQRRASACRALAGRLVKGDDVPKDLAKATALKTLVCELTRRVDPDDPCFDLGSFIDFELPKLDPTRAAPLLRARCDAERDTRACIVLGELLVGEEGTPRISKEVLKEVTDLVERACTLDRGSCEQFSLLYRLSKKDPATALAAAKWIWDHKTPSDVQGAITYPLFVREGIGANKDPAKAAALLRELCDMIGARRSWVACGAYANATMKDGPEKQQMLAREDAAMKAELQADSARNVAESSVRNARYLARLQAHAARQQAQRDSEAADEKAKYEREAAQLAAEEREARREQQREQLANERAAEARRLADLEDRRQTARAIAAAVQQVTDTISRGVAAGNGGGMGGGAASSGGGGGASPCAPCAGHSGTVTAACSADKAHSAGCYCAAAKMHQCVADAPGCATDVGQSRSEAERMRKAARDVGGSCN